MGDWDLAISPKHASPRFQLNNSVFHSTGTSIGPQERKKRGKEEKKNKRGEEGVKG